MSEVVIHHIWHPLLSGEATTNLDKPGSSSAVCEEVVAVELCIHGFNTVDVTKVMGLITAQENESTIVEIAEAAKDKEQPKEV